MLPWRAARAAFMWRRSSCLSSLASCCGKIWSHTTKWKCDQWPYDRIAGQFSARLLTTSLRMTLRLAPFSSCTVFNNYTLLGYIIYAYINLCSPWGLSSPVVPSILPWWVEHSCLGVSRRRWKRGFNDHWMPAPPEVVASLPHMTRVSIVSKNRIGITSYPSWMQFPRPQQVCRNYSCMHMELRLECNYHHSLHVVHELSSPVNDICTHSNEEV